MAMNFGPLSTEGGERRLNVLISRARERCEVFASITHDDIDLDRARSRGAAAFKTFLRYAATGVLDHRAPTGGDSDSDFERQVADALRSLGHEIHCRVGTAGFLIDLAVVDPTCPGRYLLAIECDGATYHASRSARDRDRLRDAVLRDRGWKIHRIWSADWFHWPVEQLRKVVDAIERARVEADADELPAAEPVAATEQPVEIERAPSDGTNGAASAESWIVPYIEAAIDVPSETPIPEMNLSVLAAIVTRVVEVEGPIHREEVARRISTLWGQQRTGGRMAEATSRAVDSAIGSGTLRVDADFVTHARMTVVPVRSRELVSSAGLRRPEMLPPAEIREAILRLASDHVGVGREEIPAMVARALGFRSAGAKLREAVDAVAGRIVEEGRAILRDEKLYLP
jgi:very-short-patch-repair endonuclease